MFAARNVGLLFVRPKKGIIAKQRNMAQCVLYTSTQEVRIGSAHLFPRQWLASPSFSTLFCRGISLTMNYQTKQCSFFSYGHWGLGFRAKLLVDLVEVLVLLLGCKEPARALNVFRCVSKKKQQLILFALLLAYNTLSTFARDWGIQQYKPVVKVVSSGRFLIWQPH